MRKTTISKMQIFWIVASMALAIFWSVARYSPSWGFSQTEEIAEVQREMTTPPPEKTPATQKSTRTKVTVDLAKIKYDIIVAKLMSVNGRLPRSVSEQYALYITRAAAVYDVDPFLITAVIIKESTGDFLSFSSCAHGLMQINWKVHKDWLRSVFPSMKELRDVYDPEQNILAGTLLLSGYLKRHNGDIPKALANYLGANSLDYRSKVLSNYQKMKLAYEKQI